MECLDTCTGLGTVGWDRSGGFRELCRAEVLFLTSVPPRRGRSADHGPGVGAGGMGPAVVSRESRGSAGRGDGQTAALASASLPGFPAAQRPETQLVPGPRSFPF